MEDGEKERQKQLDMKQFHINEEIKYNKAYSDNKITKEELIWMTEMLPYTTMWYIQEKGNKKTFINLKSFNFRNRMSLFNLYIKKNMSDSEKLKYQSINDKINSN